MISVADISNARTDNTLDNLPLEAFDAYHPTSRAVLLERLCDADERTYRQHLLKGKVCDKCGFGSAYREYEGTLRCMACNALWPEEKP